MSEPSDHLFDPSVYGSEPRTIRKRSASPEVKVHYPWVLVATHDARPKAHILRSSDPTPWGAYVMFCDQAGRVIRLDSEPLAPACTRCAALNGIQL